MAKTPKQKEALKKRKARAEAKRKKAEEKWRAKWDRRIRDLNSKDDEASKKKLLELGALQRQCLSPILG